MKLKEEWKYVLKYKGNVIIFLIVLIMCLAALLLSAQSANAFECPEGHVCSEKRLVTIKHNASYMSNLAPAVESIDCWHLYFKDYKYCSDGWVKNSVGYEIISDATNLEWALSNNPNKVDLSRDWQSKIAYALGDER